MIDDSREAFMPERQRVTLEQLSGELADWPGSCGLTHSPSLS